MRSITAHASIALLLLACTPAAGTRPPRAQTPVSAPTPALEQTPPVAEDTAAGAKIPASDPLEPLYQKRAALDYLHMAQPELQARLQRHSAVYFAVGGPVVAQADFEGIGPYDRVSVVAVEGDMVRILHRVIHGLLLFWLPRDDLETVIGEKVRLVHAPGQKPAQDDVGVTVFPGAVLSRLGSRDGFTEVESNGIIFYFHGWVPDGTFRDIYRIDGPERPIWVTPESNFAHQGDLRSGALVFDRPGGRVIAVAARNQQRTVYANETDIEGWWFMEFTDIEFRIRGYVHSFDVDEDAFSYGVGGGSGYGGGNRIIVTVPADTCLLDRPDGEIVGRTLNEWALAIMAEPEGGYRLETNSMGWGNVSVFLQSDSTDMGDDGLPMHWLDCSTPK